MPSRPPRIDTWLAALGRRLNGPGLLAVPVLAASLAQALAAPSGASADAATVLASGLLAWVPVAVCANAAPLLRDRAMQLRAAALLLALAAGAVLAGLLAVPGLDGPPRDGLAAALATQLCAGGLVVGLGGCVRRYVHYARGHGVARGRRL